MTNRTWSDGDALTGATLNKDISQAISAGGTFTPYTPLIGQYVRAVAWNAGASGGVVSLGAAQSTGGYSLQGDLVRFWAMYKHDHTVTFNGTPVSGQRQCIVIGTPFPYRRLDWRDYYATAVSSTLVTGEARAEQQSIQATGRINPGIGAEAFGLLSPFYDASSTNYIADAFDGYSDAQGASLVAVRSQVAQNGTTYPGTGGSNDDLSYQSNLTTLPGSTTPTAAVYDFVNADVTAWFFLSGWFFRTSDQLVEHPTHA